MCRTLRFGERTARPRGGASGIFLTPWELLSHGRKFFLPGDVYHSAMSWRTIIALLILVLQAIALFVPTVMGEAEPPKSFAVAELGRWFGEVLKFWAGFFRSMGSAPSLQVGA